MKVKKLIKLLQQMDPESKVILQRDPEGNGYSPLSVCDNEAVLVDGDAYSTLWTAEEAGQDPDEWERTKRRPRICVLAPLH